MGSHSMMSMTGMNEQSPKRKMSMMNPNHQSKFSDSLDDSQKSPQDCCTKLCNCFTGGCSSSVALIKYDTSYSGMVDLASKIFSYTHLVQSHQPTSLYRPPIIS